MSTLNNTQTTTRTQICPIYISKTSNSTYITHTADEGNAWLRQVICTTLPIPSKPATAVLNIISYMY